MATANNFQLDGIGWIGGTDPSNTRTTLDNAMAAGNGFGGAVTQATNKGTAVTLNALTGAITLNNASLASDTVVSFTLTNSYIKATDIIIWQHTSGGTLGSYSVTSTQALGSATVYLTNFSAGSLSEAAVLTFFILRSAVS